MKKAYVLVDVEKGEAGNVAAEVSGKPGILTVDVVFGHNDVVVVIQADDTDGLVKIVRDEIAPAEYVARTETLLVTSGC